MIGLELLRHRNRFLARVRRRYFFGGTKWQPEIRLRSQASKGTVCTDRKRRFRFVCDRKIASRPGVLSINHMLFKQRRPATVCQSIRFVRIVNAVFGPNTVRKMHLIWSERKYRSRDSATTNQTSQIYMYSSFFKREQQYCAFKFSERKYQSRDSATAVSSPRFWQGVIYFLRPLNIMRCSFPTAYGSKTVFLPSVKLYRSKSCFFGPYQILCIRQPWPGPVHYLAIVVPRNKRAWGRLVFAVAKLKPIIYDSISPKYSCRNLPSLSFVKIQ